MAKTPPSGTRKSSSNDANVAASVRGTANSTQKRETLQSLRRDVEDILARLRQADSLTRQSVKSLQNAFSVLEKRVGDDNQINKAALTQKVDQLTQHLTGIIKQTHAAVAKDLATAKANPTVERLAAAVQSAEGRMANAELVQAEALGKVNRHLAGLAKAIDARFSQEAMSQETRLQGVTEAIKFSQENTDQKLSDIEKASADAIIKIGERVVALSDDLNARSDKGLESVSNKIYKLTEKTTSDFETYRADLENYRSDFERRVEGLEETQRNLDSYTDRSIAKLTARIDNLEYGLTSVAPPPAPETAPFNSGNATTPLTLKSPLIDIDDPFEADLPGTMPDKVQVSLDTFLEEIPEGRLPAVPKAVTPAPVPPPSAAPLTLVAQPESVPPQAFAPMHIPATPAAPASPPQNMQPQTYAEPYGASATATPYNPGDYDTLGHFGSETQQFQPDIQPQPDYTSQQHLPQIQPTHAPSPDALAALAQHTPGLVMPENSQNFGHVDHMTHQDPLGLAPAQALYAAPENPDDIAPEDLPYEDPAYAEGAVDAGIGGGEMADGGLQRPGSFKSKKKPKKVKARKVKAKKVKLAKTASNTGVKPGSTFPGGRKAQVAGLALLLVTVGYFALRGGSEPQQGGGLGIIVEDGTGIAPLANVSGTDISGTDTTTIGASATETAGGNLPAEVSLPAIGEYQDNQGLTAGGEAIPVSTLEAAAKNGDPVAEFQLGLSHLQSGRTKDAVKLIRSSANKGQAAAQYRLAKLYEAGEGVTTDAAMARQLTERSARNGNRIAMHDLALYYAEGRGDVDVDIKTAAKWFEKAAQRGVVDSQYNLGVLYESGQGMPQNLAEAFVWYGIAARQGDQYARKHIDVLKGQLEEGDVTRGESRVAEFRPVTIDEAANGIFRNLAWSEPANVTAKSARAQVAETQTLLGQLGYDAGGADGSMGPKTRQAIVSFQKEKGLSETGKVDQALIVQLQKAAGA